jgi:Flp pilus assembly protein TadD
LADEQPPDGTLTNPEDIAQLREGITALQGGDRAHARTIFSELVQRADRDVNAWLGLAMSSDDPDEAFGALRSARGLQPDNPFIAGAATELARRWPEHAAAEERAVASEPERDALAAGIALPSDHLASLERVEVSPDAESEAVATAGGARLAEGPRRVAADERQGGGGWRRALTFAGLALVALLLVGAFWSALQNSGVFRPLAPTVTPTPPPTLAPPQVRLPPTTLPRSAAPATPPGTAAALPSVTPSSAAVTRATALKAVQEGRFAQAVPLLEQVTAREPSDAEALFALGIAYLNASDHPNGAREALLTFRSVAALQPDWPPGQQMLAEVLMRQNPPQYRDAVPPAHRAVEVDATRPEYWITLARAYEGAGDTASATQAYAEAARHSPAPPPPPPPTVPPTATHTPVPVPSGAPEVGTPTPATPPAARGETPTAAPTGETPTP